MLNSLMSKGAKHFHQQGYSYEYQKVAIRRCSAKKIWASLLYTHRSVFSYLFVKSYSLSNFPKNNFVPVITYLRGKFGINLPSQFLWNFEISWVKQARFQISKKERGKFSQILRINMWFLVYHMWQVLKSTHE